MTQERPERIRQTITRLTPYRRPITSGDPVDSLISATSFRVNLRDIAPARTASSEFSLGVPATRCAGLTHSLLLHRWRMYAPWGAGPLCIRWDTAWAYRTVPSKKNLPYPLPVAPVQGQHSSSVPRLTFAQNRASTDGKSCPSGAPTRYQRFQCMAHHPRAWWSRPQSFSEQRRHSARSVTVNMVAMIQVSAPVMLFGEVEQPGSKIIEED